MSGEVQAGAGGVADTGGASAGGQGSAPWYGGLDGETQGWMQSKGWAAPNGQPAPEFAKILPDMVKAHRSLESMNGRDKVVWPKDQADAPAWAEIHKRMGVPSKPEEYGLMPLGPDGKPDEKADRTYANAMAAAFHKHGIGKDAAHAIGQEHSRLAGELSKAADQAFVARSEQEFAALKQEWGVNADANFAAAQRAARAFGIDQETMGKMERAIGTKSLMTLLNQIGLAVSEDRVSAGGSGQGGGLTSPEAAQARLAELRQDSEWQKKYFAGDRLAVAEYDRLIQTVASRAA